MTTADDYQWIHESLEGAACVTVVIGEDRDGVLVAFNASRSMSVPVGEASGYGFDADDLVPQIAAAGVGDAGLHASGLAMVERFTGIRVLPERVASMEIAHPIIGEH